MVTLENFKSYMRIDVDWEDDLLEKFLDTATAYLTDAVSNYQTNYSTYAEFAKKADLLTMVLAAEFYQNRDNSAHSLSYTVQSMMTQLQFFTDSDSGVASSDTGILP